MTQQGVRMLFAFDYVGLFAHLHGKNIYRTVDVAIVMVHTYCNASTCKAGLSKGWPCHGWYRPRVCLLRLEWLVQVATHL